MAGSELRTGRAQPTGSASDLGLYGAAPVALVAPALLLPGASAPVHASPVAPTTTSGTSLDTAGAGGVPIAWWSDAAEVGSVVAAQAISAMTKVGPSSEAVKADAPAVKEVVAAHVGSSAPTLMWPTSPPGEAEQTAADSMSSTPQMDSPTAVEQLADGFDRTDNAIAAANAAMADMEERLGAVEDLVGGASQSAGDALADMTSAAAAQIETIEESAAATIDSLATTIVKTADELVETVSGTTEELAQTVTATSEQTLGTLAATADEVVGEVSATLAAIPDIDDLGAVGGVDPEGGVATLVGMVSAADMFGLPDMGPEPEASPVALIGTAEETLAAFAPTDVLLTAHDPQESALGLLSDLIDGQT